MAEKLSLVCVLSELIREDMKNTVSKSVKVLIAKGNSFKNLNLVVAAFSKAEAQLIHSESADLAESLSLQSRIFRKSSL